jgi:hypothetical protein
MIKAGDRVIDIAGDSGTVTKVISKQERAYVEYDTEFRGRNLWGIKISDLQKILQMELFV